MSSLLPKLISSLLTDSVHKIPCHNHVDSHTICAILTHIHLSTWDDMSQYTIILQYFPTRYTFTLPGTPPSTCSINIKQPFPYDLAFAMTVHKAQGRTIPRVIIAVRQHPNPMSSMNYAALFVALSRVKQGSHLRLIEPSSTVDTRASIYKWLLTTLSPNTDIAPFIHGFLPTQQWQFRRATAHS